MTPLKWAGVILLLPFLILIALLFGLWHVGWAITLHALLSPSGRHVTGTCSSSTRIVQTGRNTASARFFPGCRTPRSSSIGRSANLAAARSCDAAVPCLCRCEQFNPIGIVFRPFKPILIFRFWQPFRDARHGKPQQLERVKVGVPGSGIGKSAKTIPKLHLLFVFWVLLRKDEPLFDAGGVAKKHRLRIDRDDGVAAGDRVAFANQINLTVAGEDRGARPGFLRDAR